MRTYAKLLTVFTAIVLAGACGDADVAEDDDTTTQLPEPAAAPADQTAALPPDDGDVRNVDATLAEWSITLAQDSVPAGAIAFNVRNTGTMAHRFEIEGNGEEFETDDIAPGGDITMSLNLPPGVYKVYCPISAGGVNHEQRGMTTTLRVY